MTTTPSSAAGTGSQDSAESGDVATSPEEATQVTGPGDQEQAGSNPAPGGNEPDRAALRTSLAARFAAAKGEDDGQGDVTTAVQPPPVEQTAQTEPTESSEPQPGTTAATSAAHPQQPASAPGGQQNAAPGPQPYTASRGEQPGGDAPREGAPVRGAGPRKVRLALARIDPWSVMKLSFLLSIAVGIAIIVATAAMWLVLDSMHVFADIEELLVTVDSEAFLDIMEYAEFDRVISMAAIIAVVDIFLLTALATLGAFLYNIIAALVGGLHVTLTDD